MMAAARYNQLVALPFNAIASHAGQHKNCETYGLCRENLWQQTLEMMHEHYESWDNNWDSSYYHFLRARFILDDWPLERITANRNAFLEHETQHEIGMTMGRRINHGFLIADTETGRLLGERRTGHLDENPHTASGIDTVRPSERGRGLSRDFFELGCVLAKQLGYKTYHAGIASSLPMSYKRLDRMVKEGRAQKLPGDWDGARHYEVDLQRFTPRVTAPASARCG